MSEVYNLSSQSSLLYETGNPFIVEFTLHNSTNDLSLSRENAAMFPTALSHIFGTHTLSTCERNTETVKWQEAPHSSLLQLQMTHYAENIVSQYPSNRSIPPELADLKQTVDYPET